MLHKTLDQLESQAVKELDSYTTIKNVLIKTEKIKLIPDIDITIDYIKSELGRKWRCQLRRMLPVIQWFSHHSNPTMFSITMLREMRNGKSKVNGYVNSALALNDLIQLGLVKCIEKHYNPDNHQARLYTFNHSNLNSLIQLTNSLNLNSNSLINHSNIDCLSMFKDSRVTLELGGNYYSTGSGDPKLRRSQLHSITGMTWRIKMEITLDQLEELAKKDGVEYLDLNKSECFHYVEQHLNDSDDNYSRFMKGCYRFLTNAKELTVDELKMMFSPSIDDWRNDFKYGYDYAKFVISKRS